LWHYTQPRGISEVKRVRQGWKNVAEYYNLQFVDVMHINGINVFNWDTFYNSMDVHMKTEGYDLVAEIIANSVI
jgi:hypothetical protein